MLRHAPEITLVTNQWVNSYKRLVPGFEAPVYVCWARRNRSRAGPRAAVQARQGGAPRGSSTARPTPPATRTWRSPRCSRPASTGSRASTSCRPRRSNNIYEMTEAERERRRHRVAPRGPARGDPPGRRASEVLREALGDHVARVPDPQQARGVGRVQGVRDAVRAGALPPDPLDRSCRRCRTFVGMLPTPSGERA